MKTGKQITFKIPDEYQVPEGVKSGTTFDESVTFKLSPDGKSLTLWKINGIEAPGVDDGDEEGERAEAGDAGGADPSNTLAARYAAAMGGGQAGGQ